MRCESTPAKQAEVTQQDLDLSPDVDIEALIAATINIDRSASYMCLTCFPCRSTNYPTLFFLMTSHELLFVYSLKSSEREEQGFLTGLKIPAPWTSGKSLESIHPVRDNYKYKETVSIPGARCLYLRFDPRSSSQYDYDKVCLVPQRLCQCYLLRYE